MRASCRWTISDNANGVWKSECGKSLGLIPNSSPADNFMAYCPFCSMPLVVAGDDDTVYINIEYPRVENSKRKRVNVGLEDVRAADDILIEYDFDRDGYVIKQASKFEWDIDDLVCDPDWQEVAFIQAWAREDNE